MTKGFATEVCPGEIEKKQELETELFRVGLIFLAAGAVVGGVYYFWLRRFLPQLPCFFSGILGIYCPGCGGTRALIALVRGRLLQSIWYHPLVPYMAFIGGGFMLTQGLARVGVKGIRGWKYHSWYLYGGIALILINFLIKNILRIGWGITM